MPSLLAWLRTRGEEATFATTIPDANPVYAGNITLAGNATIGMSPDSIASTFSINGNVNVGGNTLTLNAAGGSGPASFIQVNGVVSGAGNVIKGVSQPGLRKTA